jgi:hypothetical protein
MQITLTETIVNKPKTYFIFCGYLLKALSWLGNEFRVTPSDINKREKPGMKLIDQRTETASAFWVAYSTEVAAATAAQPTPLDYLSLYATQLHTHFHKRFIIWVPACLSSLLLRDIKSNHNNNNPGRQPAHMHAHGDSLFVWKSRSPRRGCTLFVSLARWCSKAGDQSQR